jgi:integrase
MPSESYSVQRLNGRYVLVAWINGKRRRRVLESTDRQSAEAEARQVWDAGDRSPWTVGRVMTAYLVSIEGKASKGRRDDAWKAMRGFWEHVNPALIDEPMCKAYRGQRAVGDATARYELMQLSTALNWAVGEGKIAGRRPVWLPPEPERKTRHLEWSEWLAFSAAIKADHARLYAMIGLYTMARPSAILELTWDRVDFIRGMIDFTPPGHVRTAKRRTVVPIAADLRPALARGFEARTCQYVIERGGKRVACIKKAFQAASERSGVHATPYTLRHTGAVYAAEAGVSMAELAQFMGHDDDRTTQKHYARFSPGHLRGVADAIGSKGRGQLSGSGPCLDDAVSA